MKFDHSTSLFFLKHIHLDTHFGNVPNIPSLHRSFNNNQLTGSIPTMSSSVIFCEIENKLILFPRDVAAFIPNSCSWIFIFRQNNECQSFKWIDPYSTSLTEHPPFFEEFVEEKWRESIKKRSFLKIIDNLKINSWTFFFLTIEIPKILMFKFRI